MQPAITRLGNPMHAAHNCSETRTRGGGPQVADHRDFIERVLGVVQRRIEQAERVGLQKLEQAERKGRREYEKAGRKHQQKMRKLEKRLRDEERREDQRGRRRHRHADRRERRQSRMVPPLPSVPPVPGVSRTRRRKRAATPEERAYRAARRRANLKLVFYTHSAVYGSVLLIIMAATRSIRVSMIVAFSWGIFLFLHYFWTLLAPSLRENWIQKEVGERVHKDVSSERERVEQGHVRNLEDLSASIAHEIRNPITAAKSLVQQMGEDPGRDDNIEYASVALEELDRVERSISHLLRFARDEELNFGNVEMADVVASAIETFRERIARAGVEVDQQMDTRGAMRGDPDKLRRVVINLVGNALDALESVHTESPRLTIMSGDNLAGSEVWLRVQDNGPGMEPETQSKIFDPFYTTKESGTGLGLALSKKVVEAHGGTMEVQSSPGNGTEFVLSFPKEAPRRAPSARGSA